MKAKRMIAIKKIKNLKIYRVIKVLKCLNILHVKRSIRKVAIVVCKKKPKTKTKKWLSLKMKMGIDSATTQVQTWKSTFRIFSYTIRIVIKTRPLTNRWLNFRDSDPTKQWPLSSSLKTSSTRKSSAEGERREIYPLRIISKIMWGTISKSCPTTSILRSATNL